MGGGTLSDHRLKDKSHQTDPRDMIKAKQVRADTNNNQLAYAMENEQVKVEVILYCQRENSNTISRMIIVSCFGVFWLLAHHGRPLPCFRTISS